MLLGKISTKACNGPASFCEEAFISLSVTPASFSYFIFIFSIVSGDMPSPGFKVFTIVKPIIIAIKVVPTYITMVLSPIVLILEMSFKSDIPLINEAKINGTAISLRRLIKIFPKGAIQSETKPLPVSPTLFIIKPKMIPNTIPIIIFQCNASFMYFVLFIISAKAVIN